MEADADVLFEISWEVCNKVGGIHTVIVSKAALMKEINKVYYLIGPYVEKKARIVFSKEEVPLEFQKIFDELSQEGIICHYGKWDIKGEPKTILIEFSGFANRKNDIKKELWDRFRIDSLNSGWDFEEPVLWSYASAKLIEKFVNLNKKKIVVHFHEWLAGAGLLYLTGKIPTIFTTHATTLGRTMASAGRELYNTLDTLDADREAYSLGINAKHQLEKACAHNATVFTTVSEITSIEAEKILGKKPDILVLNGLDTDKFPTFEELSIKHRESRSIIREFVSYYFFPYYFFDIEETLIFFIVGRYEFKNKGVDIFIKSLANLNNMLKEEKSKKTIIAFFWIPRDVLSTRTELAQNKNTYDNVKHFVERYLPTLQLKILDTIFMDPLENFANEKKFCKPGKLFDRDFLKGAKRLKLNFVKEGNPPITTHFLAGEEHDIIVKNLLDTGLDNKEDDRVKVIFYPVYLSGVDGLLDLPYYDTIVGCHLGLFPSYYEPWGYTPLESAALGVPSLTTDLGGFGRFLINQKRDGQGIYVLKRFKTSEEEIITHFTKILYDFCKLNREDRVREKINAKNTSNLADWRLLIQNYTKAHNLALEKHKSQ
ncbi:hypothetical protein DRJ17_03825 [Candidatus Woesearchaeota archaeon]|nr:MAG: hypothetical protein DRJ17_03825 [Candidatus Woesearchaeota archaeon]